MGRCGGMKHKCPLRCHIPCQLHDPCWERGERDVQFLMERQYSRQHEQFCNYLSSLGRQDLIDEYRARIRALDTGMTTARATWHSLTSVQQRVMEALESRWALCRTNWSKSRYEAIGGTGAIFNFCGLPTVRKLVSHDLLAWDGGAFDPEARAVLTERGHFVLRHGRG
jgi:hypothetical protein